MTCWAGRSRAPEVFALAYVLLPFSDVPPANAITAFLARFQRGGPSDLPEDRIDACLPRVPGQRNRI